MTRISLDSIESLRLPELQALFAETTGETTKSPNKKFLIRRIRETLAAQAAEIIEEEKAIEELAAARIEERAAELGVAAEPAIETVIAAERVSESVEPTNEQVSADEAAITAELVAESAEPAESNTKELAATEEPAITEELAESCNTDEAAIITELVTESADGSTEEPASTEEPMASSSTDEPAVTTEPADDQDTATEALEDEIECFATEADITQILEQEETMMAPADDANDDEPAVESADNGTKLSKLSVTELQTRYLEVVGRPTGSSYKRYLVWKIREAQKGRIPVGQRSTRSATAEGTEADIKILPLRMESSLVEQLDAARERLGLKSRMDLFRKALGAYLAGAGETELAAAFSTES